MGAVTTVTLDDLRDDQHGDSYPKHLLEGCETALVLFAAGFYGRQDALWIADAGLTATCVDTDEHKLVAMLRLYPGDWTYFNYDVYDLPVWFDEKFDIVSADPWTHDFQKCADHIADWSARARRAVILGTGVDTHVVAPDGWSITGISKRSDYQGGVFWTTLEPK